jgi:glycosyltransferase involved in cell wall biosynthesis
MKVSIYIRTYKRDVEWLDFCLQSIEKNLKGWSEIVVGIPDGQEPHLRYLKNVKIVTEPYFKEDYIGQQISKLLSYRHTSGDYTLIVDSDLIFLPGANVSDYLDGDLPIIGIKSFSTSEKFIPTFNKLFKKSPTFSYMQGHGARLYKRSTLESFGRHFPDIEIFGKKLSRREFSEFEFLGFFIHLNEPQNYRLLDLDKDSSPTYHTRQFWNVDGLTKEILTELNQLGFTKRWPDTLSLWDKFRRWLSQTTRKIKKILRKNESQTPVENFFQ